MNTKPSIFLSIFILFFLLGCQTIPVKPKPISWNRQQAYLSRVRDPRIFGLSIYQTPTGLQIRGGGRLHPRQAAAFPMKAKRPLRPVVELGGTFRSKGAVLIDLLSSRTWLEFNIAKKLKATPVGEQKAELVLCPDEDVSACLSILPSLRLGQLYIENQLVYVRLSEGSLGSLARNMEELGLQGVIGWDIIQKMEQVRLLYSTGQIALFTTDPYDPNPAQLLETLPLVPHAGACVVRGIIDGTDHLILIDPAGDFEIATENGTPVNSLQLSTKWVLSDLESAISPGGIRIGARLLEKYDITICPKKGIVHFEYLSSERENS